MKEEKLIKIITEEDLKSKFKKYEKIISFIELLLVVGPIVIIFLILPVSIAMLVGTNSVDSDEIVNEVANNVAVDINSNISESTFEDTNELTNNINDLKSDDNDNKIDENNITPAKSIFAIITAIMQIIVIENVRKMFKQISINGKPFTEYNVEKMKNISKYSVIMWIAGFFIDFSFAGIGIVTVVVLCAVSTIFKYGYKLQIESDETL